MARPKRRNTAKRQEMGLGEVVVDFIRRRTAGEQVPRGFYGPVDEDLVAHLKRRLNKEN